MDVVHVKASPDVITSHRNSLSLSLFSAMQRMVDKLKRMVISDLQPGWTWRERASPINFGTLSSYIGVQGSEPRSLIHLSRIQ